MDVGRVRLSRNIVEAGLKRGALAKVHRVANNPRSGCLGQRNTVVGAAIIDAEDMRELFPQSGNNVPNDFGFIK